MLLALVLLSIIATASAANNTFLTSTALVTDKFNNSALQCWEFITPFSVSSDAGTSGAATLSFNTTEAVYTVIPPRFNGGIHRAPKAQSVFQKSNIHVPRITIDFGSLGWLFFLPAWRISHFLQTIVPKLGSLVGAPTALS